MTYEDPHENIAILIVQRALLDYELLLRKHIDEYKVHSECPVSRKEIKEFFESDYCKQLLSLTDLNPQKLLKDATEWILHSQAPMLRRTDCVTTFY